MCDGRCRCEAHRVADFTDARWVSAGRDRRPDDLEDGPLAFGEAGGCEPGAAVESVPEVSALSPMGPNVAAIRQRIKHLFEKS